MEYEDGTVRDLTKRAFWECLEYKKINFCICILFFLPAFWIEYGLENVIWFFWEKQGISVFFLEGTFFLLLYFVSSIFLQPIGEIALLAAWKQNEQKHIFSVLKYIFQKMADGIFALFLAGVIEAIAVLFFLLILFLLPKGMLFGILFLPLFLICVGIVCYLQTIWCFVLQSVVLEDKKGWQALENSRQMVKGRFVETAVLFFGTRLLQTAFYFLISVTIGFLSLFFVFFSVFTNTIVAESICIFFKSMTVTAYSVLLLRLYYWHIQREEQREFTRFLYNK